MQIGSRHDWRHGIGILEARRPPRHARHSPYLFPNQLAKDHLEREKSMPDYEKIPLEMHQMPTLG